MPFNASLTASGEGAIELAIICMPSQYQQLPIAMLPSVSRREQGTGASFAAFFSVSGDAFLC
jgi:hypothetical protein